MYKMRGPWAPFFSWENFWVSNKFVTGRWQQQKQSSYVQLQVIELHSKLLTWCHMYETAFGLIAHLLLQSGNGEVQGGEHYRKGSFLISFAGNLVRSQVLLMRHLLLYPCGSASMLDIMPFKSANAPHTQMSWGSFSLLGEFKKSRTFIKYWIKL